MDCEDCLKSCPNCNIELRQKYINAVLNIDVEGLERLLKTEPFEREMLDRLLPSFPKGCSILYIIKCWEIILADEWKGEYGEIVERRRKQNEKIKRIFIEKLQAEFNPIEWYIEPFYFYRKWDDDTVEDILDKTREELNELGFCDLDIDLYCAVCKFDFKETERLLKAGANPNTNIDGEYDPEFDEEPENCFDRIGRECDGLEFALLRDLIRGDEYVTSDYYCYLTDLVGLAAHKGMYSLLLEYDKE